LAQDYRGKNNRLLLLHHGFQADLLCNDRPGNISNYCQALRLAGQKFQKLLLHFLPDLLQIAKSEPDSVVKGKQDSSVFLLRLWFEFTIYT
jgi:hypothetical protein